MLRKFFVAVPVAVLAVGGTTACASKKFVRTSVGEVNDKVDSMGRSLEETQERTRKNEGRIAQLQEMLERAEIVAPPADDGVVEPGMVVTYKFEGDDDDEAETFLLIGAREGAPSDIAVYTPEAPLGAAINGHSKGETVSYEVNGKTQTVIILDAKPYGS